MPGTDWMYDYFVKSLGTDDFSMLEYAGYRKNYKPAPFNSFYQDPEDTISEEKELSPVPQPKDAATIDLDVIDAAGVSLRKDGAIEDEATYWKPGSLRAWTISQMIVLVSNHVRTPGTLRRLRINGHGKPGVQGVASSMDAIGGTGTQYEVLGKATGLPDAGIFLRDGKLVQGSQFSLLAPLFCSWGWIELRGCSVASGAEGKALLVAVAQATGRPVLGAAANQSTGPWNWIGSVWCGYPDGTCACLRSSGQAATRRTISTMGK